MFLNNLQLKTKNLKQLIFVLSLVLSFQSLVFSVVFAQTGDIFGPNLNFVVSKFRPLVGENFSLKLRGSSDLNTKEANVAWYLNGAFQKDASGMGMSEFSFIAGELGKSYEIRAVARTLAGKILENTYKTQVSDLNLTWFAETKAPDGFLGYAMPSPASTIHISGQPIIVSGNSQFNPSRLFYRWSLNGSEKDQASGFGKSEFIFKAPSFSGVNQLVTLEVENEVKTIALRKSIKIKIVKPEVLIFNGNTTISKDFVFKKGEEANLVAKPYFFGEDLWNLGFEWLFNNNKIEGNPDNPYILRLKAPQEGDFKGTQFLSLKVANKYNSSQKAEKNISIKIE